MSQPTFPGGIDLLPGLQGPPVPANGLRIVTIGGALFTTIDGLTFTSIAGNVPLATPSAAGLMSAAQAGQLSGLVTAYTPIMDLTTVQDGVSFIQPLVYPGNFFMSVGLKIVFTAASGTATGSLVCSAGNDANHGNILSTGGATVTSTTINNDTPLVPVYAQQGSSFTATFLDLATEIKAKVVTAPAGMTTLMGRIILVGILFPSSL